MAFTSAVLEESKKLGSGEVLRTRPFNVEAFSTFEMPTADEGGDA